MHGEYNPSTKNEKGESEVFALFPAIELTKTAYKKSAGGANPPADFVFQAKSLQ